jgi:16S rRNA (guanine527-N7)-methyltransferase
MENKPDTFFTNHILRNKNGVGPHLLIEHIASGVQSLGQKLSEEGLEKCARLLCELHRWNARMNLTAIRDTGEMISGHLLDSLSVRPLIYGKSLIDIGTGAGFPGLPIAIAEPRLTVEVLDSNARKIGFVQHVIGELDISNAHAVRSRAENYAPGKRFDTVVARALASVPRLIEIAGHLVTEKGVMLAQKGRYPGEELEDIADAWDYEVTEVAVPGLDARHIVAIRRKKSQA